MKLTTILAAAYATRIVSAQFGETYQRKDVVIDMDKVTISNKDDCGKVKRDIDSLYKDFTIIDSTLVNTTKTADCRSPVGSTALDGLSGDNIIYGDNIVVFLVGSGLLVPNTMLGGSANFDLSVDIDSLKLDGDFSIQLKLDWIKSVQTVATDTLTFSEKSDGQPPYKVNVKKEGIQADSFRIWATIFDGKERYSRRYSLAVFNLDFLLLIKDDNGGEGKTSSSARPRQTSSTVAPTSSPENRPFPTTTTSHGFSEEESTTTSSTTAPTSTTTRNAGFHLVPSLGFWFAGLVASAFL